MRLTLLKLGALTLTKCWASVLRREGPASEKGDGIGGLEGVVSGVLEGVVKGVIKVEVRLDVDGVDGTDCGSKSESLSDERSMSISRRETVWSVVVGESSIEIGPKNMVFLKIG
jgi:hypothetical protein